MIMPIRVTYLITDLKVGGVPLHLYRLATSLPPEQVRVRVISLADEGPVGLRLRQAGIPVLACGARSAGDLGAVWRLWQILRSDPPDILHALLFHANMAARVVGPAAGIPVHRILCEIQTVELERPWHLVLDNLTCRRCCLEIGNSPSVIRHLHESAHLPMSRLHCEIGAVDVEAIRSAVPIPRQQLGVQPGETLVLWSGRLDPVKGFEEMLAGFKLAALPSARFVLAGEGAYRPTIERLICQHQLENRVILLGERADIPRLLRSADLFLFCSRTEGLPNAVLEAMAAGLPIIATDVPGCRDLIRHHDTGWLVRPGAAEDIAEALTTLRGDGALAGRLGANGQTWASSFADISTLAGRWGRLYSRVLCRSHEKISAGSCVGRQVSVKM